jgi:hypothetical protein
MIDSPLAVGGSRRGQVVVQATTVDDGQPQLVIDGRVNAVRAQSASAGAG